MTSTAVGDRRYWMVATWSIAAWFAVNIAVLVIAGNAIDSNARDLPPAAYFVAAGVSTVVAALLQWRARGVVRAVALAAVVVASLWACAALAVGLLHLLAK
ncbi:hypothetical protein [Nocardia sp. NPDC050406]|uniref:hypothetical protein n=1 Tax=Nocardia sp. NPDC050406 TaxID=3364318 RepID=UPI0037B1B9CD